MTIGCVHKMTKQRALANRCYLDDGRVPVPVLHLIFSFFEKNDLLSASCLSKFLRGYALNNRVWKNQYYKAYKKKLEQPELRPNFLGLESHAYHRAYVQEIISKKIRKVGNFVCLAPGNVVHSGCRDSCSVISLFSLECNECVYFASVFADGRIAVYRLMDGTVVHVHDTQEGARNLMADYTLDEKRSDLGSAHKNKLFTFKVQPQAYEGSGFDLWSSPINTNTIVSGSTFASAESFDKENSTIESGSVVSPIKESLLQLSVSPIYSGKANPFLDGKPLRGPKGMTVVTSNPSLMETPKMKRGKLIGKQTSDAIPIRNSKSRSRKGLGRRAVRAERRRMFDSIPTSPELSSDSETESRSQSSYSSYQGESSSLLSESISSGIESDCSLEKLRKRSNGRNGKGRKRNSQGKREHKDSGTKANNFFSCRIDAKSIAGLVSYKHILNVFCVRVSAKEEDDSDCGKVQSAQNLLRVPTWARREVDSRISCVSFIKTTGINLLTTIDAAHRKPSDLSVRQRDKDAVLTLATGHENGTVALWNDKLEFSHFVRAARHVPITAIHLENTFLVTGDEKGLIQTWEPSNSRKLGSVNNQNCSVFKLVLLEYLMVGGFVDGTISVWRRTGQLLSKLAIQNSGPFCMDVMNPIMEASEAEKMIVRIATGGKDNLVKIWKVDCRPSRLMVESRSFKGHTDEILQVHVDTHRLVSCSKDGTIKAWEVEHPVGKLLRTFKSKGKSGKCPVVAQVILPNVVIGGRSDGSIFAFDFSTRQTLTERNNNMSRSSSKIKNQIGHHQSKKAHTLRPRVMVGRDSYMDILYDEEF